VSRKRKEVGSIRRFLHRLFGAAGEPERPKDAAPDDPSESLPDSYVVTDFLDLHGFWPEQVGEVVDEFLQNAANLGLAEVRIAHGKGKSVMRREVWKVLEKHRLVAEFHQAPPDRGSWGATIVRLEQRS